MTYTAPSRIVRGGFLVAFEGEVMTDDEAVERGLVTPAKSEPKPKRNLEGMKKAELAAEAERLGIAVPKKATVAQLKVLIEQV